MALTFEAIVGTTTYNLNNGTSLWLEEADGLVDESPSRRLSERGPEQHGVTDLGVRLDPRTITLRFNMRGASGSALESYRDNLRAIFQPNSSTPIKIKVTRDDGEVRQIDCYRVGPVGIPLKKEERPGYLNRAVVQLIAPDPNFYDPTQQAGTLSATGIDWWLAYNTIGTATVLEHVESPTQGQLWTTFGTHTYWTIAFRSGDFSSATDNSAFGWKVESAQSPSRFTALGGSAYRFDYKGAVQFSGTSLMQSGTHNYFIVNSPGTFAANLAYYADNSLITTASRGTAQIAGGGSARWRSRESGSVSNLWTPSLPYAAIYGTALDANQRAALHAAMSGSPTLTLNIGYEGDWEEYPIIDIYGPVSDPVIVNTTTGESLNFTGYTIGSGDSYRIDTRYGYKTIRNSGGDNKIQQLSSDSDLESFHLAPAPLAIGGTNVFSLTGTATSGNTSVVISYYNRYTGP